MEKREVVVIGGGMAGLLTAFFLQKEGKDVLLLEGKKVASGQTGRTTAKITSQHGLKYSNLIKKVGLAKARLYARANEDAINMYERLIDDEGIECDFERVPAYLYSCRSSKAIEEEANGADCVGIDAFMTRKNQLPFDVKATLCFPRQAQFTPLKFVGAIAGKLEIRENEMVRDIKGHRIITDKEELWADKIVVATHYPFINVPGFYFLRQHQERSYVLALKGNELMDGMYYGIDDDGLSLRQEGDRLLLGGGGHRTGKKGGGFEALIKAREEFFPEAVIDSRWAAQDCMPHDGIPFIGKYSVFTPHMYVATGFQKWGMTTSMVAAELLTDLICGRENPYESLFTPQRFNWAAGIKDFLIDSGESVINLSKGIMSRPRCSHLGCKLQWNLQERSWDCPCHGSRFDEEGNVLDNPSLKKLIFMQKP